MRSAARLEPALDEGARGGVGIERSELHLSREGVDLAAMTLEHFGDQRLAHTAMQLFHEPLAPAFST